jgi:hypothetical protein
MSEMKFVSAVHHGRHGNAPIQGRHWLLGAEALEANGTRMKLLE